MSTKSKKNVPLIVAAFSKMIYGFMCIDFKRFNTSVVDGQSEVVERFEYCIRCTRKASGVSFVSQFHVEGTLMTMFYRSFIESVLLTFCCLPVLIPQGQTQKNTKITSNINKVVKT